MSLRSTLASWAAVYGIIMFIAGWIKGIYHLSRIKYGVFLIIYLMAVYFLYYLSEIIIAENEFERMWIGLMYFTFGAILAIIPLAITVSKSKITDVHIEESTFFHTMTSNIITLIISLIMWFIGLICYSEWNIFSVLAIWAIINAIILTCYNMIIIVKNRETNEGK